MSGLYPGCTPMIGFGSNLEASTLAIPNRLIWTRSDSDVVEVAGSVLWNDRTGGLKYLFAEDPAVAPAVFTSGGVNNRPYLEFGFDGYSRLDFSTAALAGNSQLEIFIIFSRNLEAEAEGGGGIYELWGSNISSHVPYPANGLIYDSFATNLRKDNIPCPVGVVTSACCYNAASKAGYWRNSLNGVQLFETLSNGYAMGPTPGIGSHGTTVYLKGKLYEVLMFNRVLSAAERATVVSYCRSLYNFV